MDILRELEVISLGHMAYQQAWEIQEQMAKERGADAVPDRLLFVEHPHTYTLGSSGHMENVLLSPDELKARGISIYDVNRGGDVTYHGPGQLVGYPIVKLPAARPMLIPAIPGCGWTRLSRQPRSPQLASK